MVSFTGALIAEKSEDIFAGVVKLPSPVPAQVLFVTRKKGGSTFCFKSSTLRE
jgi:hypothetical protein